MIKSITKEQYCIGCRMQPVRQHFKPREDDFNKRYFQINDTTYFVWSEAFKQAAEQDQIWNKLKHD